MVISRILTIQQAAELLNVRQSWIYQRTCDGALRGTGRGRRSARKGPKKPSPVEVLERVPHFKIGRLLRFDREELLAWFANMHVEGSKPSVKEPEGAKQAACSQEDVQVC